MYNTHTKIAFFVKQKILSIAGFLKDFFFPVFNFSVLYVVDSPGNHTIYLTSQTY